MTWHRKLDDQKKADGNVRSPVVVDVIDTSGCLVIRNLLKSQMITQMYNSFFCNPLVSRGQCGGLVISQRHGSSTVDHSDTKVPHGIEATPGPMRKRRWNTSAEAQDRAGTNVNETMGQETSVVRDSKMTQNFNTVQIGGANEELFHISDNRVVDVGEACGLHGQWIVELPSLNGAAPECAADEETSELIQRLTGIIQAACEASGYVTSSTLDLLNSFICDSVAVSFENVGGRTISKSKTLCGWSYEPDLTTSDRRKMWDKDEQYIGDVVPKISINLGSHAVQWGFKYDKSDSDKDMLVVDLNPGDCIIRCGEARSWCMACVGITASKDSAKKSGSATPSRAHGISLDFCHLKLQDHRQLKQHKALVYQKCHSPFPVVLDHLKESPVDKWFQYSYEYIGDGKAKITNVAQLRFIDASEGPSSGMQKENVQSKQANPDIKLLEDLIAKLEVHMANDDLIKGWEADRRTCIGKQRGPLRAAARDIRAKSVKAVRAETKSNVSATQVKQLSVDERTYLLAIQKLYVEMAKAGEQDFDAFLRDGLDWCTIIHYRLSSGSSTVMIVPYVLPAVFSAVNGERLLARLHKQRNSGHRGIAIERDLREATRCAKEARQCWLKMQKQAGDLDEAELVNVQKTYLLWLEKLMIQLEKEGEPDFDGLLRNGINFLENNGKRVCF
eukprot:gnl/MRDRNA2_/MRDRNA2_58422_c0_seq1.p1 gnl/MRDRNA2_/MRDRNA2_58422_c0~~gnl/MRDRNA2_/MRDRNA2_58422_c0_seq1.p1  ORF type:complete len:673 (+),score=135.42 gnl/MRDRNA2_/MRDRNA2_58422_c0_seq1:84-2102(+)